MAQMYPGGDNIYGDIKFRFFCDAHKFFYIEINPPPERIPISAECPWCKGLSEWCFMPIVTMARSSDYKERLWKSVDSRKAYTKEFQQHEIVEAEKRLKGEKGISPYSKYEVDYEYFEENGVMRRVKNSTGINARKKVSAEMAKNAETYLEEEEKTIIGKRPDG